MSRYTWSGQGTTSAWNDAGNWTPNGSPGAADIAAFTSQNATVSGDEQVGAVNIITATSLIFTGSVTTHGVASTASSFQVGANARVDFAPGSNLTVADQLTVGVDGGYTTMDFQGAALTTRNTVIGVGANTAASFSIENDAVWSNAKSLIIGKSGDGGLSIGGGSVFVGTFGRHPHGGQVLLGQQAGSNGALDVTGGGTLLSSGEISIGGLPGARSHGNGEVSVGPGSVVDAFGTLSVAAGSTISLSDGGIVARVLTVAAYGTLSGSGNASGSSAWVNNGQVSAIGTLFLDGQITGTGSLGIGAGATLGLLGSSIAQSSIRFLGPDGTLFFRNPDPDPQAPIVGFHPGDRIEAAYVRSVGFDGTTDKLTLYSAPGSTEGTLTLSGNYAGDIFHVDYASGFGTITVSH